MQVSHKNEATPVTWSVLGGWKEARHVTEDMTVANSPQTSQKGTAHTQGTVSVYFAKFFLRKLTFEVLFP